MEIIDVYKRVPDREEPVLKGVTGSLSPHGVTVLIGPSGSGKSTLLKLMNRLEDPDSGGIRFQGKDLRYWDVRVLRRKVAMIFQQPTPLPGTVLDNILFVLKLQQIESQGATVWLERVGLPEKLWRQPAKNLSGGERQRLALARALIGKPEFLLVDEGTAALDPSSARVVEELLLRINQEEGLGILWISHDPEQVMRIAGQVWALHNGTITSKGEPGEVLGEEMVRSFFGGGGQG